MRIHIALRQIQAAISPIHSAIRSSFYHCHRCDTSRYACTNFYASVISACARFLFVLSSLGFSAHDYVSQQMYVNCIAISRNGHSKRFALTHRFYLEILIDTFSCSNLRKISLDAVYVGCAHNATTKSNQIHFSELSALDSRHVLNGEQLLRNLQIFEISKIN